MFILLELQDAKPLGALGLTFRVKCCIFLVLETLNIKISQYKKRSLIVNQHCLLFLDLCWPKTLCDVNIRVFFTTPGVEVKATFVAAEKIIMLDVDDIDR